MRMLKARLPNVQFEGLLSGRQFLSSRETIITLESSNYFAIASNSSALSGRVATSSHQSSKADCWPPDLLRMLDPGNITWWLFRDAINRSPYNFTTNLIIRISSIFHISLSFCEEQHGFWLLSNTYGVIEIAKLISRKDADDFYLINIIIWPLLNRPTQLEVRIC